MQLTFLFFYYYSINYFETEVSPPPAGNPIVTNVTKGTIFTSVVPLDVITGDVDRLNVVFDLKYSSDAVYP